MRPLSLIACVLAVALAAGGGCGAHEPQPTARPTMPLQPPANSVVAQTPVAAPNLDHFGNLRGGDTRVLGFELPMGSKATGKGISQYISVSEERFVRFFRSRGYRIETLSQSAHKITHTERTLAQLGAEDTQRFTPAQIFVDPGPGPGFTMLFNTGRPVVTKRSVLDELAEAERQNDPEFKAAAAREAARVAKRAEEAAAAAAVKPGFAGAPRSSKVAIPKQVFPSAPRRRIYTPADVKRLREKAKARLSNPKVRAMREKIRAWERRTGRVFYE